MEKLFTPSSISLMQIRSIYQKYKIFLFNPAPIQISQPAHNKQPNKKKSPKAAFRGGFEGGLGVKRGRWGNEVVGVGIGLLMMKGEITIWLGESGRKLAIFQLKIINILTFYNCFRKHLAALLPSRCNASLNI